MILLLPFILILVVQGAAVSHQNEKNLRMRSTAGAKTSWTNFSVNIPPTYPWSLPRITTTILNGQRIFSHADSDEQFVVRGNNYIRLNGTQGYPPNLLPVFHSTFNVGFYNSSESQSALRYMSELNYNFVRVFIDQGTKKRSSGMNGAYNSSEPLSKEYLDNLADFLKRAGRLKIYTLITIGADMPVNEYWDSCWRHSLPNWAGYPNLMFMAPEPVACFAKYAGMLVQELSSRLNRDTSCIFSLSLQNEMTFKATAPPFSPAWRTKVIETADGRTYNMSTPVERQESLDSNAVNFLNKAALAVRQVSSIMVTVGMYTFQAVGKPNGPNGVLPCHPRACDPRHPPRPASLSRWSSLDYLDVHIYPRGNGWSMADDLKSDEWDAIDFSRMVIASFETGSFKMFQKSVEAALDILTDVIHKGCTEFNIAGGFALWTWDTWEQPHLWNGKDSNFTLGTAFSPAHWPDPCYLPGQMGVVSLQFYARSALS